MREDVYSDGPRSDPLSAVGFGNVAIAAQDRARISGLTHNFYRYPARFSPNLVRAVIEEFTQPGDLVLDPFMGGGTTLVEAIALGRCAVGVDISSLATFVAEVKTMVLSGPEMQALDRWSLSLIDAINIHSDSKSSKGYMDAGYLRHMRSAKTWRLCKAVEQSLAAAEGLRAPRLIKFARCIVLRTAQWALDGRKELPDVAGFRRTIQLHTKDMLRGALELRAAVRAYPSVGKRRVRCVNRSAIGLETRPPCGDRAPKLVLTSPPYPGVHVLYHRWQVDGRKETPAPFWIANKLDGSGSAYYTLGDRHVPNQRTYFDGLEAALTSVAKLCDRSTLIVQVVAFSEPKAHLRRYLEVAESAGLIEVSVPSGVAGRIWRSVPNRKWHADRLGNSPSSKEVILFHRLS